MKLTKRIAAIAATVAMAMTSVVGMSASAKYDDNESISYISVVPYATTSNKLSITKHEQEQTQWCWAACTQILLEYYGTNMSQEDIVKYAKGTETAANVAGNATDVKKVLNDKLSKSFTSSTLTYAAITNKINANNPVILMGTETTSTESSNHAVVCYGYDKSNSASLVLYIYDPKNGESSTMTCTSDRATAYSYGNITFSLVSAVYTNSSTTL